MTRAEPGVLIEQLKKDEAIAEADTLLFRSHPRQPQGKARASRWDGGVVARLWHDLAGHTLSSRCRD
jgi:hypothetical protein